MILQDLVALYEREAARGKVLPYGYSPERISWVLVIDGEGRAVSVEDLRDGKKAPRIPAPTPPKSTVNIEPRYLYGNASYVLGTLTKSQKKKSDEGKSQEAYKRCADERAAWVNYHRKNLAGNDDEGLKAVLKFCDRWRPDEASGLRYAEEIDDGTIALRLADDVGHDGQPRMIYERSAAREIWSRLADPGDEPKAVCLITGLHGPIASLHPSIKGIWGAKSSGASFVSYNCAAVEHFGPDSQGLNGPVSVAAVHAYTSALNARLSNPAHSLKIGDATAALWVETDGDPTPAEELLEALLSSRAVKPGEDIEEARLRETLTSIAAGRPLADADPRLDPNSRYHVLALAAPAKARLTVRWYLVGTLGTLSQRLGEHWHDMTIEPGAWRTPPSVQRLALQTVPARPRKSGGYDLDPDDINPTLPGDILRTILTGQPYPSGLLQTLVQRISTDRDVSAIRVAMVRACLARNQRLGIANIGAPMSLDPENPSAAYQLGRLFAVLDRVYRTANPGSERTLTDGHYRMSSTQPAAAFPRLLATAQHHLAAIRREGKGGLAYVLRADIEDIAGRLGSEFPPLLSVTDQGRFALGYYHQSRMRKSSETADTNNSQET